MSSGAVIFIAGCLLFFFISLVNEINGRGLYLGAALGVFMLHMPKTIFSCFGYLAKILLFANLFMYVNNLFFGSLIEIPPMLPSLSSVYQQGVYRSIYFFGEELRFQRVVGIADNLHVTGYLLLLLAFYTKNLKHNFLFLIVMLLIFLSLNFQILITAIIWLVLSNRDIRISSKEFIKICTMGFLLLLFIDGVFHGGAYLSLIYGTSFESIAKEFAHYRSYLNLQTLLFGIKPGTIPDISGQEPGALVLSDIGIFGIPLQHGLVGLLVMIKFISIIISRSSKNFQVFIFASLFMVVHYFPMISFPAMLAISWLCGVNKKVD